MGPPNDVPGECNARLFIGDDFGDNSATMRCSLVPGHDGSHEKRYGEPGARIVVTWEKDERGACGVCGKLDNRGLDWCGDEHLDIICARDEAGQSATEPGKANAGKVTP